jgi:tetratricopeptide (TPR) repeat protein
MGTEVLQWNMRRFQLILIHLALILPSLAGVASYAQESSSRQARGPVKAVSGVETGAAQSAPAQPSPTPEVHKRRYSPEAEDAMNKGQELLFKKHDAKASVDEFKRAVKLDPWYGQAYMLLGLAQMQLGQWADAQWAFEEAEKVEPGDPKAYLGAGSAFNEQKNYPAAQKALEHSLELRPDMAEAHYELARSLWGQGKWQAAEPHALRAIELNKDYAGPHALMGNIYLQQEDPEAALKEFEECLQLDPESSMAPAVKEKIAEIRKALGQ